MTDEYQIITLTNAENLPFVNDTVYIIYTHYIRYILHTRLFIAIARLEIGME